MVWLNSLQKASFRGVSFEIDSATLEGGRRLVEHEFPFQDKPEYEDLGRKAKPIVIEGLVIGDDYFPKRDALEKALEQKGSGQLVHPYRGTLQVVVDSYRLSETTNEGGMARFSMTFKLAEDNTNSLVISDNKQVLIDRSNTALTAFEQDFIKDFSVDKQPAFVSQSAETMLDDALELVDKASSLASGAPSPPALLGYKLNELGLINKTLIQSPADLSGSLQDVLADLVGVFINPKDQVQALKLFSKFGDLWRNISPTTPSRKQEQTNQTSFQSFVKRVALMEEAKASSSLQPESTRHAATIRDDLIQRLQAEKVLAADNGQDSSYHALTDVIVAVNKHLTSLAGELPQVIQIESTITQPALVLAHRFYGDDLSLVEGKAADIIQRNSIRHPGFVKGKQTLEVLTNV
ncbi:MAG: DNA circularization N-terminal domain-containing protein [Alphaproteobacteria bacterium]|nr:DNA circularization N-terminal domain-containing protein [Alphaproteobacteria bacterium]MDD9919784.1 DNA circularization N-terminal domain-containing protein [Alphaproteobacteria bacterium]